MKKKIKSKVNKIKTLFQDIKVERISEENPKLDDVGNKTTMSQVKSSVESLTNRMVHM